MEEQEARKRIDGLLGALIKRIEQFEALIAMVSGLTAEKRRPALISDTLREIAGLVDSLPLMVNDLYELKKSARGMLSTDPDKTPRALSLRDVDTVFSPVEDRAHHFRGKTKPGLAGLPPAFPIRTIPPPLPKKKE